MSFKTKTAIKIGPSPGPKSIGGWFCTTCSSPRHLAECHFLIFFPVARASRSTTILGWDGPIKVGAAQKQIGSVEQRNSNADTTTCQDPCSLAPWCVTESLRCSSRSGSGFIIGCWVLTSVIGGCGVSLQETSKAISSRMLRMGALAGPRYVIPFTVNSAKSRLIWWFDVIPGEADNTVRENKNNCQMKLMCALLQKQLLRVTALLFPRVGHSHGSLGNFACITVWKTLCKCLESPLVGYMKCFFDLSH